MSERIQWRHVINAAREIVDSYDTPVTLRQLFYRLVAQLLIPNRRSTYTRLSSVTAEARKHGDFPELIDRTRQIHQYRSFSSPGDLIRYASAIYRRDRTEGQTVSLYLGVEKAGIVNQLQTWFGAPLGVPILALGGYASQAYVNEIIRHVQRQDRPAVLLYAGDHDPSGWDIPRDFVERTDCWKHVHRIALTPEQVIEHNLPESIGKEEDTRKSGFIARFGKLVQVEVDALPPDVLRGLFNDAITEYWDTSTFEAVVARENEEADKIAELARRWQP